MGLSLDQRWTMKSVAEILAEPAHRVIHLCEHGVLNPIVRSRGRGSVRRFDREDIFRLSVAFELQNHRLPMPRITPLSNCFDELNEMPEFQTVKAEGGETDLPGALHDLGDLEKPVFVFLTLESPHPDLWIP